MVRPYNVGNTPNPICSPPAGCPPAWLTWSVVCECVHEPFGSRFGSKSSAKCPECKCVKPLSSFNMIDNENTKTDHACSITLVRYILAGRNFRANPGNYEVQAGVPIFARLLMFISSVCWMRAGHQSCVLDEGRAVHQ